VGRKVARSLDVPGRAPRHSCLGDLYLGLGLLFGFREAFKKSEIFPDKAERRFGTGPARADMLGGVQLLAVRSEIGRDKGFQAGFYHADKCRFAARGPCFQSAEDWKGVAFLAEIEVVDCPLGPLGTG
jgi:hypothetical protein